MEGNLTFQIVVFVAYAVSIIVAIVSGNRLLRRAREQMRKQ